MFTSGYSRNADSQLTDPNIPKNARWSEINLIPVHGDASMLRPQSVKQTGIIHPPTRVFQLGSNSRLRNDAEVKFHIFVFVSRISGEVFASK